MNICKSYNIYNSRNLYKVLNIMENSSLALIYNSRNLYKVLNPNIKNFLTDLQ